MWVCYLDNKDAPSLTFTPAVSLPSHQHSVNTVMGSYFFDVQRAKQAIR